MTEFLISISLYPFLSIYILGCIVALITILFFNKEELNKENAQWEIISGVVLFSWISVIVCVYFKIKDNN